MNELNKNKRQKSWFKAGYAIMDIYAQSIGPFPTLIYLFLKSYEYQKTRYSWPSEELIADKLHISTRTVKRGIKVLDTHHFITIEKIPQKGKWPCNLYYLTHSKDWLMLPCASQSHSEKYPQGDRRYKTCVTYSHDKNINDKNIVLEILKNHKIQTKNKSP